jgi:Trk K+ transport system NAD-binding subunit
LFFALTTGYSIAEVVVPLELVNKSLSELRIRSNYGLEVLMIKHLQEIFSESKEKELIISADPNYKIKWKDKLVVFVWIKYPYIKTNLKDLSDNVYYVNY